MHWEGQTRRNLLLAQNREIPFPFSSLLSSADIFITASLGLSLLDTPIQSLISSRWW